jgi:hypothetical protein
MRFRLLTFTIAAALGSGMTHAASATDIDANTQITGKMFFDFTHFDQTDAGQQTAASGTGLDVKRFYLGVDHTFDDVWSANLTTDFNYSASDGETQVFVKKAYVQGAFDKAAVLRVGSADMPWIPFVESYYGYRYVENTLIDRLKEGNSADWGLHLGGSLGNDSALNYAVSTVNGAGYKNPTRSSNVDIEGRVGYAPITGMIFAIGGYSGKLGKDTQGSTAYNTATRFDFLAAYASKTLRVGAEYFTADNWANVATTYADKANGWSVWGSAALGGPWSVFARYDDARLSRDIDPQARDKYFNAGLQYAVNKNFLLAAVFKHEQQDDDPNLAMPVAIPIGVHADRRGNEIGIWGQVSF